MIVHSFMYPYYFLQAVNMGKPLQRWGINALLTSLQLTQMVLGTYMTLHVQYKCPEAHKYPQGYYYATLGKNCIGFTSESYLLHFQLPLQ